MKQLRAGTSPRERGPYKGRGGRASSRVLNAEARRAGGGRNPSLRLDGGEQPRSAVIQMTRSIRHIMKTSAEQKAAMSYLILNLNFMISITTIFLLMFLLQKNLMVVMISQRVDNY